MAHLSLSASHSIIGAKVGHFQSGIVDQIMAEVAEIPPYPEERGGLERHFQVDSTTLQGIQRGYDDYETILIVRIVEIFQEKVVVQGYCIVVRDAILADGTDQDMVDLLQRAVKAAGDADAHVTVGEATLSMNDRNPFENLMDEVRRVQDENRKEKSDEQ